VKIGDRIDFICPYLNPHLTLPFAEVEVLQIHSVSQWAYDYCALTADSVVVGVCNNPHRRTFVTVVFREYTPKPGGLEFRAGKSYYFISTSTGLPGGIENKHGGLCLSRNMKVKFEIEPGASSSNSITSPVDSRFTSKVGRMQLGASLDERAASDGSSFSAMGDRTLSSSQNFAKSDSRGQQSSNLEDTASPVLYQINVQSKDGRRSQLADFKGDVSRVNENAGNRIYDLLSVFHVLAFALIYAFAIT